MRLWACSVAGLPSVHRHSASSSFSWKSRNCSIAQRWTLKGTEQNNSPLKVNNPRTRSAVWTCVGTNTLQVTFCCMCPLTALCSVWQHFDNSENRTWCSISTVIWPFFGYRRLLKSSDCDRHFLQKVTASQVFYFLRWYRALRFHCRDLLLHMHTQTHTENKWMWLCVWLTPVKKTHIIDVITVCLTLLGLGAGICKCYNWDNVKIKELSDKGKWWEYAHHSIHLDWFYLAKNTFFCWVCPQQFFALLLHLTWDWLWLCISTSDNSTSTGGGLNRNLEAL